MRTQPFLAAMLLLLVGSASHADHGGVTGRKLLIKALPSGNKIVVRGTAGVGTDVGTADPRCSAPGGGGGALHVDGGNGNAFTIPLPCQGWRALGSSQLHPDYMYKDPSQASCTLVQLRPFSRVLKVICKGPQVAYALGAPQGDISIRVETGSAPDRNCLLFGPSPTRVVKDGSDGKTYLAKDGPGGDCGSPAPAFLDGAE